MTTESDAKVTRSEDEWRDQLTAEEYEITRNAGTERAFTGIYWDTKTPGIYNCKCCNTPLFDSTTKYDSGSGWPSFYAPISEGVVTEHEDLSYGMRRVEIKCSTCDAHLGHLFPDGPNPTGMRYCMNSASLNLDEKEG